MSQRDSGYARQKLDSYETPAWVTRALLRHLPRSAPCGIWEPACGTGKMAIVLEEIAEVVRSDIVDGFDFLVREPDRLLLDGIDGIVTNPPYAEADRFITRALELTEQRRGFVAMLLRTDFDHAQRRGPLFCSPMFAKKLVLTRRIKWFEDSAGSPSFNYAWFIWDWTHEGPSILAYGP